MTDAQKELAEVALKAMSDLLKTLDENTDTFFEINEMYWNLDAAKEQ
jgi:hypothetical protein